MMVSMTKTRLGALRCPAAQMGAGAEVTFGVPFGSDVSAYWLVQHRQPVRTLSTVELIPPYTVDNTTRVSAPPERSP